MVEGAVNLGLRPMKTRMRMLMRREERNDKLVDGAAYKVMVGWYLSRVQRLMKAHEGRVTVRKPTLGGVAGLSFCEFGYRFEEMGSVDGRYLC